MAGLLVQPRDAHHVCQARALERAGARACSRSSLTATSSLNGPNVFSQSQHFHACALPSERRRRKSHQLPACLTDSRKPAQSRRVVLTADSISMSWCDGESIVDTVSSLPCVSSLLLTTKPFISVNACTLFAPLASSIKASCMLMLVA
jgi:hypothetical protein